MPDQRPIYRDRAEERCSQVKMAGHKIQKGSVSPVEKYLRDLSEWLASGIPSEWEAVVTTDKNSMRSGESIKARWVFHIKGRFHQCAAVAAFAARIQATSRFQYQ